VAISLVGLVLAACSAQEMSRPTAPVQLRDVQLLVDRTTYSRGDTILATVTNGTSLQLIHGACSLTLQQRRGDAWVLAEQLVGVCTMQAFRVRPGTSETLRKVVQSGLAPGDYRVELTLSLDEPEQRLDISAPSNSFHVE